MGGCIHSPKHPTCGNNIYDIFVTDARLQPAVLGVSLVRDTGAKPHSAVRLWLRGRPRQHLVRVLKPPGKAEANLPRGCLNDQADMGWESIGAQSSIEEHGEAHALDEGYAKLISMMELQLADIAGLDGRSRSAMCCRALGPQFIMQPLLGRPGSCGLKASRITVAWKTVSGWLADVLSGFGAQSPVQAKGRASRSKRFLMHHCWHSLGEGVHALAFRQWVGSISPAHLEDRLMTNWLRATSMLIA